MDVESLIKRNAQFAESGYRPGLHIIPMLKTFVIGCVDPRVDPAQVLGLELGESAVLRNIGGRVTPAALQELALLRKLTQAAGSDFDQGWLFVVLQHTECGIVRMQSEPAMLAEYLGVDESHLAEQKVGDPHAAVARDLEALRQDPRLPKSMQCTGLVYDVNTGRVEETK